MSVIVQRSQIVKPTESVQLISKFYKNGVLTDTDSFPTVSIIQPDGMVIISNTTQGVYRLAVGTYAFLYDVPLVGALGVWTDRWTGSISGNITINEFNFIIEATQLPSINSDGYLSLGDPICFSYSQIAIRNINILMAIVRARLSSSGLSKTKDEFGNDVFQSCDIFSVEQLTVFIAAALSAFNQIPTFTAFTFESTEILNIFAEVIVQHAVIYALSAKSIQERGREFGLTDNGVSFTPPSVAELLNSQFTAELGAWGEKVKLIKANMKPIGVGLSQYASMGSPRLRVFRSLRSRQLY